MKKSVFLLLAILILSITVNMYGQVSAYVFNNSVGSYTALPGGTVLGTAVSGGTGATALDAINYNLEDGTLPFNFLFNGQPYTGINVRTDGYITFGTTAPGASAYSPISASTGYDGAISAVGANLQGRTTSGSLGEIRYQTIGSAPNREFVVQYKNFRRQASSYTADVFDFQIHLVETSNTVFIIYAAFTVTSTTNSTSQVGLRGALNSDYNNRATTSNWSSTTAGTSNSASCRISNTVKPVAGLTFTWTLPTVPPNAALNVSPSDTGSGIYINASLNWANGGYFPTGYKLFLGTDNPPTDIVNGTDLGNVTTYSPILTPLTQYFWRIQPYNAYGDNTTGSIWSFTTAGAPLADTLSIGLGCDYENFTDAITALNSVGASSSGVTFEVSSDGVFIENPPAILASGSETGAVIFRKSGQGANPIIKPSGTASTGEFGIKLDKTDYVTFDGIDIMNNSGTDLEYGYWIAGSSVDRCNHNIIKNCTITLDRTNTNTKGIYLQSAAGSALFANSDNVFQNNTISNSYHGIYIIGSSTAGREDRNNEIDANTINDCTSYHIYFAYQQDFKLHDTIINLVNGVTNSVYGIYADGSTTTAEIKGNTVSGAGNNVSSGLVYGVYLNSVGTVLCHDNIISDYTAGSSAYGLYLGQGNHIAYKNIITRLTGANSVYGIYTFASGNAEMKANNIYNLESTTATTGKAYGIYTSGTTFTVSNNMISDLKNQNGISSVQIYGIYVSGGTNYLYYNSVLLNANSNDASFSTAAIYASTSATQIYMNNNIFIDKSTPGLNGRAVAFWRNNTGYTNINSTSGNNLYYAGTPDSKHLIFYDGTNSFEALADYKLSANPRDAVSFSEDVPFLNSYNLHIDTTIPTIVESSGSIIPSVIDDIDGDIRDIDTPDLGADEGNFTLIVGVPGPAVLVSPDNNAINIDPFTFVLDWDIPLTGGTPTGYTIGISDSLTEIVALTFDYSAEVAADVTGFSPFANSITLEYNKTWYWVIIPFNEGGHQELSDSLIWSFTTIRAPLTGIKTINPDGTGDDNYTSFSAAIADIGLLGLGSGGITFEVKDANNFTEELSPITISGTAANPIIFRRDNSSSARPAIVVTSSIAGIQLVGCDYITFDGIDIKIGSGTAVNYGFSLIPGSTSNGAQHNEIKNCNITLNHENTLSKGIYQSNNSLTPINAAGANSYNKYTNITIENCIMGIYLNGSSAITYPDTGIEISGCTIGGDAAGNMGGNMHGYGIYSYYQKNLTVNGCDIRNFDALGNYFNHGIYTYFVQGNLTISNNKIHDIQISNTSSSNYSQYGMYIHLLETDLPANAKIFNNMIWNITSAYNGVSTSTTLVFGIYLSVFGSNVFNVDFNTVKISGPLTANSACFYYNSATTGIIKARNNIFANYTPAQTGSNVHYCIYSPVAGSIGNTGSVSDNNILYVNNAGNGYIGKGGSVLYSYLDSWISGMNADVHSNSLDPKFEDNSVYIRSDVYTSVESRGSFFDGADNINWVSADIDGNVRNVTNPDIGADEGNFVGKPNTPVAVIKKNSQGNIILTWAADPNAISYKVYCSGDDNVSEPWTFLATVTNCTYQYSPENNNQMFFRIVTVAQ